MESKVDSYVSVLSVEPEMLAQLELCDTIRSARARVDLACVSTCGGACHALDSSGYDVLLLSTNLCFYPDERPALFELLAAARSRGSALVALGPSKLDVARRLLRLPVHDTLSHQDISAGRMNAVLAGARSLAGMDGAFSTLVENDRAALSGRMMEHAHRAALRLITEGQQVWELSAGSGEPLAAVLRRLRETLSYAAIGRDEARRPARLVTVLDQAFSCVNALRGDVRLARGAIDESAQTSVDAALLRHFLVRVCLALLQTASTASSALTFEIKTAIDEAWIEVHTSARLPTDPGIRTFFEPFGHAGEDGMGLWATYHLLSRWGARFELRTSDAETDATTVRVAIPSFGSRAVSDGIGNEAETVVASTPGEVMSRTAGAAGGASL